MSYINRKVGSHEVRFRKLGALPMLRITAKAVKDNSNILSILFGSLSIKSSDGEDISLMAFFDELQEHGLDMFGIGMASKLMSSAAMSFSSLEPESVEWLATQLLVDNCRVDGVDIVSNVDDKSKQVSIEEWEIDLVPLLAILKEAIKVQCGPFGLRRATSEDTTSEATAKS